LSPLLISFGFDPYFVVPAILISQAAGGTVATYRHNYFKNGDFRLGSKDIKIVLVISVLGIFGTILGVWFGKSISKDVLRIYISILCIIMGALVILKKRFNFSWKGMYLIGLISSFNKAFSGGGFGPIVTSSQVILGRKSKNAISSTDFAEVPICIMAFILWVIAKGVPNIRMTLALIIGATIGAYIGPKLLFSIKDKRKVELIVGVLVVALGILSLMKFQV
ncbi:MAG: sulfite exporter TauE/SafE family protein, partial [Candidatus Roizmanbacteria bacterium]|nr:sulfite exporter TauE/SafE family protein [Candidatus Roizmanbacteria bacterium]